MVKLGFILVFDLDFLEFLTTNYTCTASHKDLDLEKVFNIVNFLPYYITQDWCDKSHCSGDFIFIFFWFGEHIQ